MAFALPSVAFHLRVVLQVRRSILSILQIASETTMSRPPRTHASMLSHFLSDVSALVTFIGVEVTLMFRPLALSLHQASLYTVLR